jgi:Skp family chaperone for outer membrane proteins
MKRFNYIATTFLFVLLFALPLFAQTANSGKVGIINTNEFYEEKGITKLVTAYAALDKEFAPKTQELQALATKIEGLAKEIQNLTSQLQANPKAPIDPNQIVAKREEGERLQIDFKRKEEDLKAAIQRREAVVVSPIRRDLGNKMIEWSNTKGFGLVLDLAKLAESGIILSYDKTIDLTDEFIKYYNALPATTATTTTPATKPAGTAAKPN